jgi:hypothetical protein
MDINTLTLAQAKALRDVLNKMTLPEDATYQVEFTTGGNGGGGSFGKPSVPVIVCTDKRAVVFGYTKDTAARPIVLTDARMCLYWSSDVGGVFGLAEIGPTQDCRISAVVPTITLEGVTAILSVDPKAEQAWLKAKVQGR